MGYAGVGCTASAFGELGSHRLRSAPAASAAAKIRLAARLHMAIGHQVRKPQISLMNSTPATAPCKGHLMASGARHLSSTSSCWRICRGHKADCIALAEQKIYVWKGLRSNVDGVIAAIVILPAGDVGDRAYYAK